MAKRKSAQRRNKKFKAADPFARGKSQKNLGQDVGFGYTGGMEDMPKNLKTILKKEKQSASTENKPRGRTDKEKKKSAVYRMLSEGGDFGEQPKIKFVKKSYETMAEFKDRMHAECQNAITIANGTKTRNVVKEFKQATKLDKNNGQIPEDQKPKQKSINRKRLERKQIAKEKKSDKELEKLEKEMLKDRVEFGERVDAPPEFKSLPRGAAKKTSGRFSNLLLLQKLGLPEHQVEQKTKQKTREEELAEERKRAIEEYRKLRTIRT